jgi:hypothetical protein
MDLSGLDVKLFIPKVALQFELLGDSFLVRSTRAAFRF